MYITVYAVSTAESSDTYNTNVYPGALECLSSRLVSSCIVEKGYVLLDT